MIHKMMDCFVNPVKCRMLLEIYSKQESTANQLAEVLSDVPRATLYRYLRRMREDGVLRVVRENRIRGVTQKVYAISGHLTDEGNRMLEQNPGEGYLLLFWQFMGTLFREFADYASRDDIDLMKDGTGFWVCPIYATPAEVADLNQRVGKILEAFAQTGPSPGRQFHSIALITTPPRTGPKANE